MGDFQTFYSFITKIYLSLPVKSFSNFTLALGKASLASAFITESIKLAVSFPVSLSRSGVIPKSSAHFNIFSSERPRCFSARYKAFLSEFIPGSPLCIPFS